jgi:(E)-4-hydroxy-3-methylbut-2-enyl-diphosphate synthase
MGRPRKWSDRNCFEAVLYGLDTGCRWRELPAGFPPKSTVYNRFIFWIKSGTFAKALKRTRKRMALGILLAQGIGDTIRISLTADSIEEVLAGHEVLRSLGLRKRGMNLISCPACGRCEVDLHGLTSQVEALVAKLDVPLTVAVMGCFVNGPGEAEQADLGIAGGKGQYYVFRGEERIMKVPEDQALEVFKQELDRAVAEYKAANPTPPVTLSSPG